MLNKKERVFKDGERPQVHGYWVGAGRVSGSSEDLDSPHQILYQARAPGRARTQG